MTTARIDIRCTDQQKRRIERTASEMGVTRTDFLLLAAERLMKERQEKTAKRKDDN